MMRAKPLYLLTLAALLHGGMAAAQVYKWKDDKGVTHYSDQPPPPAAAARTRVEVKSFDTGSGNVGLPSPLSELVRSQPVTLYTGGQCEGCTNGRALLMARGIPFNEKTVTTAADQAALKQAGSNNQLPLLLVGRSKLTGFEQGSWDNLLSNAGYPNEKMLPANYQYPPAVSAAPPPGPTPEQQARAAAEAARTEQARRPLPPLNAPPGFQF